MADKRKMHQRKHFNMNFALDRTKAEKMKGRDQIMLQKKTEYWQEVNSE